MKKYIKPIFILLCVAAAAVTYLAFENLTVALIFAAWGVMVWAFFGNKDEKLTGSNTDIDPKKLKEYRRSHPGASITDAINAMQ